MPRPTPQQPTVQPDVRLLLLALPQFGLLPFGAFLDKLRFSADDEDHSRQRYCTWTLLGLDGQAVPSSSGVQVQVDTTPEALDFAAYDYLVVFGSRTAEQSMALAGRYAPVLRAASRHGLPLVAIDNASFLLARAGLLKGYEVALHWRHVAQFRSLFASIAVRQDLIYCFDRDRISCAGGTAAIDMAVELLARHMGRERASKGLADMLVDEPRHSAHPLRSMVSDPALGRHLARALALMRNSLGERLSIAALAQRIGIGRRHLDRLFQEHLGTSAHAYWTQLRLEHAQWRIEHSTHSLAAIADEVGLSSTHSLARLMRQHRGASPGQLRAAKGPGR